MRFIAPLFLHAVSPSGATQKGFHSRFPIGYVGQRTVYISRVLFGRHAAYATFSPFDFRSSPNGGPGPTYALFTRFDFVLWTTRRKKKHHTYTHTDANEAWVCRFRTRGVKISVQLGGRLNFPSYANAGDDGETDVNSNQESTPRESTAKLHLYDDAVLMRPTLLSKRAKRMSQKYRETHAEPICNKTITCD